jgi:hypothetical protein
VTAALAMALGFGSVAAVAVTASTASSQMQSTGGDGGTTACGVTSAEYATAPPPDCDGGDVAA